MAFRPMLACQAPSDLSLLSLSDYLVSPKLDGIRCVIGWDGVPQTRSGKTIPNRAFRSALTNPDLAGLDGEIIFGAANAPNVFAATSSAVRTEDKSPAGLTFHVFDCLPPASNPLLKAAVRQNDAANKVAACGCAFVQMVPQHLVSALSALLQLEAEMLERGFEGLMLRHVAGRYKYGRATAREATLFKMKRFEIDEAIVVGFEESLTNENAAFTNELGYTSRSSHAENQLPTNSLGALICKAEGFSETFKIGSGFHESERQLFWPHRNELLGRTVRFKYQAVGSTAERPRSPIFKAFRLKEDMEGFVGE